MRGIFIVGTGRSGTHFTARLLNGFSNTWDPLGGEENKEILTDIAKAAIHHRTPSNSTQKYYSELLNSTNHVVLDQHHPNLFFVEHWNEMFNDIIFLYPQRPSYQVVASMMRHAGILKWYEYVQAIRQRTINRVPFPNQFLGVRDFSELKTLPLHLLCLHRIAAHRRAFETKSASIGVTLRSVDYEGLVANPLQEFTRIFLPSEMAKLGNYTPTERPQHSSLTKYLDVLSEAQVAEIEAYASSIEF